MAETNGRDPRPSDQSETPLLEVRQLRKHFPVRGGRFSRVVGQLRAVDGVDLSVGRGSTLGIVGESGSGKTTLGQLIVRLIEPSSGRVNLDGTDITSLRGKELTAIRQRMQIVFQDPYRSFDPRAPIGDSIGEPLHTHLKVGKVERRTRAVDLLDLVQLSATYVDRFPGELSGGQLQRVAIARALAIQPSLLVLDEPVSSLDVSTQAQVINLLKGLQEQLGLTYLFIAHDLSLVRHISDQMAVMYLGRIVESGSAEEISSAPKHPYSALLLSAVPQPEVRRNGAKRDRLLLHGDPPSPVNVPSGCRFHTRCPFAMEICQEVDPPAFRATDGSSVHCHLHTSGPRLAGKTIYELDGRLDP